MMVKRLAGLHLTGRPRKAAHSRLFDVEMSAVMAKRVCSGDWVKNWGESWTTMEC